MKKLIAISAMALVMTSCTTPVGATLRTSAVVHQQVKEPVNLIDKVMAAKQVLKAHTKLLHNTKKLNNVLRQLKSHVYKTRYVFSGATPSGWDCSGLTMWAYEQLGVNLEHKASKQKDAGIKVKSPKVGDIVAFTYIGTHSAYHVGLYLGPDTMIHAGGGKGDYTRIVSISKFAGNYSKVTYRRVLQTL